MQHFSPGLLLDCSSQAPFLSMPRKPLSSRPAAAEARTCGPIGRSTAPASVDRVRPAIPEGTARVANDAARTRMAHRRGRGDDHHNGQAAEVWRCQPRARHLHDQHCSWRQGMAARPGPPSKPGQWGIPYQKDLEIGRTPMKVGKTAKPVENVTISIDDAAGNGALCASNGARRARRCPSPSGDAVTQRLAVEDWEPGPASPSSAPVRPAPWRRSSPPPAAQRRSVERTRDGGRKILISGGGRCNILPARLDESRFVTDSSPQHAPAIVRVVAAARADRVLRARAAVPLVEEPESGKLFPRRNGARCARQAARACAARRACRSVIDTLVTGSSRTSAADGSSSAARPATDVDAVVLATGGLSVPNTGSDGHGLRIAEPARTRHAPDLRRPLRRCWRPSPPFASCRASRCRSRSPPRSGARQARRRGGFLFTHRGLQRTRRARCVARRGALARRAERTGARSRSQWTPLNDRDWEEALRPRAEAHCAGGARRRSCPIVSPTRSLTGAGRSRASRCRS